MADQPHFQFGFRHIELCKEDTFGTGSYGGVCKAKCDGLVCAAKIMHPTLFDLRDPGTVSYLRKFEEECRLLSLARHPNVVQYLATYRDPDTRLPVLLMELCDESLCRFLERSPGPLPYHTQLNISQDITLALVYLHSNGLIHRDLTGNNVLMIAGVRAKITDFGMSKLASVNPRMNPMTLCPGNVQYMSPEALEEPPSYTAKLDVFSFGVLLVQIMTRQFPNPGPRFQVVEDPRYPDGVVRIAVPETQRRNSHLKLIANTHPLKAIAISCLKGKERERPSAQQLSNTLSELKRAPQYTESLQQADPGVGGGRETDSLRRQVQDLQQQNLTQEQEIDQKEQQLEEKRGEIEQLQVEHDRVAAQIDEMATQNQELGQQLQGQRVLTEAKMREVQKLQSRVQEERELRQTSEQLVAQFQQSLEQKDRTISDLRQTISAHERKTQQLGQQASSGEVTMAGTASVVKDITKLRWKKGKKVPEPMCRGSATIDGNTVYISSMGSSKVYSCQITPQDQQWSTLPQNRYSNFSLAIVAGILTSVGGQQGYWFTNSLRSLTGRGEKRQWSEVFPAMPTPRSATASISTEQALIVAGGCRNSKNLDTVEVMDIYTKQWTTASCLPHPFAVISATICGDQLYLAGGYVEFGKSSKSVLTCSLTDLLPPQSLGARLRTLSLADKTGIDRKRGGRRGRRYQRWRQARHLPVTHSTLITLGGHLLAVGGEDDSHKSTAAVHCYDARTDSWRAVSHMKERRSQPLIAVLPEYQLLVVGGWESDSVEIGSLP